MDQSKWIVRLRGARFAHGRPADEFRLLGSVKHGASIGALAGTPDGRYVQVNCDWVAPLDTKEVTRAVRAAAAREDAAHAGLPVARKGVSPQTTVVVVKRRRVPATA